VVLTRMPIWGGAAGDGAAASGVAARARKSRRGSAGASGAFGMGLDRIICPWRGSFEGGQLAESRMQFRGERECYLFVRRGRRSLAERGTIS